MADSSNQMLLHARYKLRERNITPLAGQNQHNPNIHYTPYMLMTPHVNSNIIRKMNLIQL